MLNTTIPDSYRLSIEVNKKSLAKILKIFSTKTIISGNKFELTFKIRNLCKDVFPGGELFYDIHWTACNQTVRGSFVITPLASGNTFESDKITTDALCAGFGLILLNRQQRWTVKDKLVYFHTKEAPDEPVSPEAAVDSIDSRAAEELYQFWAMIISAISLGIIALEKAIQFLIWLCFPQTPPAAT